MKPINVITLLEASLKLLNASLIIDTLLLINATTIFVAKDETADIFNITKQVSEDININVVDPKFESANHGGLLNYLDGFVKEGAGAGGAMFMALMCGYNIDEIKNKIVENCSK